MREMIGLITILMDLILYGFQNHELMSVNACTNFRFRTLFNIYGSCIIIGFEKLLSPNEKIVYTEIIETLIPYFEFEPYEDFLL
jgi:hypothetical protein